MFLNNYVITSKLKLKHNYIYIYIILYILDNKIQIMLVDYDESSNEE